MLSLYQFLDELMMVVAGRPMIDPIMFLGLRGSEKETNDCCSDGHRKALLSVADLYTLQIIMFQRDGTVYVLCGCTVLQLVMFFWRVDGHELS